QHGDTKEVALIQDAVVKGDVTQLPAILQILDATGALDYVRNVAKKETSLACAAIASFADSDQKKLLQDLADFAVNRQY
ncbi:MAG TPA: octaprenyl diphosphate synthase, partial [Methylophilaceae bacterium]|nr:octaprenyl diphosphate synthase [Methylophilaceae bacterium]